MNKGHTFLLAASMIAVALAGCTSDGDPTPEPEVVDTDSYELEAGKGAIAGILVDDRFRPIDLSDESTNEFEAVGYILVQELAQQIQTDANGVFQILDLEPGTYTLKVAAEGFEAMPATVSVEEGIFNEVQVLARRVASEGDVIITQEHAAFASCFVNFVALSYTLDCTGDNSGDTDRAAWYPDLKSLNETLSYVVVEVLFDNAAPATTAFDMVAREGPIGTDFSAFLLEDDDGRYGKMHLPIDQITPDPPVPGGGCKATTDEPGGFCPWNTTKTLQIIMFGRGFFYQEVKDGYAPVLGVAEQGPCIPLLLVPCFQDMTMRRGAGGALGTQATYMLSAFLYDPEADGTLLHETDFCTLCNPDA